MAGLEREDELSTLRAFFQIIGQPICRILRQFYLFPTEAYAQTLIFGPTDSYKSFVHDKTEL